MHDKLVSVVITTYGRTESLIFEAINSVRNQTYKNIEIIVIDDNGLGTELQQENEKIFQAEKDIRYIANKRNSGASASRNAGILASNGIYIACLDDDDIWMEEKIEKQVALMEKENLALVFCNGYRFYNNDINNKKPYQFNFISDKELDFITELRSDHIGSTSIPLMRKECFAQTGLFDVDMPAREDYEMWLRFCRHCKVKGIDEPLFYYRYHDGERITKSKSNGLRSCQFLWKKYREDYKKDRAARAGILFSMCKTHLETKRIIKAIWYGAYSFISSPTVIINLVKNHWKHRPQF